MYITYDFMSFHCEFTLVDRNGEIILLEASNGKGGFECKQRLARREILISTFLVCLEISKPCCE
jgi:hypothetical protein